MSTAYVEKVVYPPSTPTPRNGRSSRCADHTSTTRTMSTPMSRHPDTLVTNVAHGNRPGRCGHATTSPYRPRAPSAPPAEMAPRTAHGARRSADKRRLTGPAQVLAHDL